MTILMRMVDKLPARLKNSMKTPFTEALYRKFVWNPYNSDMHEMWIELTNRCNLACTYCPKSKLTHEKGADMDFELFCDIIDEAFNLTPPTHIGLVGFGEPFLYPRLVETISYIKRKSLSVPIILVTNGILVTSEKSRAIIESGLDEIHFSVNASSREQYKNINGKDLYNTVVTNTKNFIAIADKMSSNIKIYVQVLQGPNGPREIEIFRRNWEPFLGTRSLIHVATFINWAGMISTPRGEIKIQERYPCHHLQSGRFIKHSGEAIACCMAFAGQQSTLNLGNIREKGLKKLYKEGKILKLREMNLDGRLNELEPCKDCNAYKSVPNTRYKNPFYPLVGRRWW